MGQAFLVVNHTLKECFSPQSLGEADKLHGLVRGEWTTLATSCLVLRTTNDKLTGTLAGTWSGCQTELLGEYDFEPYQRARREYGDIGAAVAAMLAIVYPEARDAFVDRFGQDDFLAISVGNAVFQEGCEPLRSALERVHGIDWPKRYKAAREAWPVRQYQQG